MATFLITGGAGFIGTALCRYFLDATEHRVVNLDKLTYAADTQRLAELKTHNRYAFVQADICDAHAVNAAFREHQPDGVMHLAAESHVDRSIDGPAEFLQTNIFGTFTMLEAARNYWRDLDGAAKTGFRFHHVSTDEVFGSLGPDGLFLEETAYDPRSPYSASKASSDHLVMAWHHTYGLPVVMSNCSNNYGPGQFPEKLIPLMILNATAGKPLPVYGKGENVRDWLFVEDHARALALIATEGKIGETYNVGGRCEKQNIEVVKTLCALLDDRLPESPYTPHESLINFVADRPGHDLRYAIDCTKIERELGWTPAETFETGLAKTVDWYLANDAWCSAIKDSYSGERLGLSGK